MKQDNVILVDENDHKIGLMEKIEAHKKGFLHRAFSIFIFNNKGELMIQQRAKDKYHSPMLWTNTCCSHQRIGETNIQAGKRRLMEEMGFICELTDVFSFIYRSPFNNGLIEHELDHVMVGLFNGKPKINKKEVESYKWITLEKLINDIDKNPDKYTIWFKIILKKSFDKISTYAKINCS